MNRVTLILWTKREGFYRRLFPFLPSLCLCNPTYCRVMGVNLISCQGTFVVSLLHMGVGIVSAIIEPVYARVSIFQVTSESSTPMPCLYMTVVRSFFTLVFPLIVYYDATLTKTLRRRFNLHLASSPIFRRRRCVEAHAGDERPENDAGPRIPPPPRDIDADIRLAMLRHNLNVVDRVSEDAGGPQVGPELSCQNFMTTCGRRNIARGDDPVWV